MISPDFAVHQFHSHADFGDFAERGERGVDRRWVLAGFPQSVFGGDDVRVSEALPGQGAHVEWLGEQSGDAGHTVFVGAARVRQAELNQHAIDRVRVLKDESASDVYDRQPVPVDRGQQLASGGHFVTLTYRDPIPRAGDPLTKCSRSC